MQQRASHPAPKQSLPVLKRALLWGVLSVAIDLVLRWQVGSFGRRVRVGTDFNIYWSAGALLHHGQNPYQPIYGRLGFVYPPFALLPFRMLSHWAVEPAFQIWLAVEAVSLAILLVLAVREGMRASLVAPALLVIVADGYVYRCTTMGQVGVLLLLLVAIDILWAAHGRPHGLLVGIAIGLKLTPAIFVAYWMLRRDWRGVLLSILGFLGTLCAGLLGAPTATHRYWETLLHQHQLGTGVPTQYGNANNQSLTNAVQILWGPSPDHAAIGHGVALTLTLLGLLAGVAAGRSSRPWLTIALVGTTSCLATGSAWDHHYVWSIAAIISVLSGELSGAWATIAVVVLWTAWSFPRRWHALARVPRARLTAIQSAESVATPVFAMLFILAAMTELWHEQRRARTTGDAGA